MVMYHEDVYCNNCSFKKNNMDFLIGKHISSHSCPRCNLHTLNLKNKKMKEKILSVRGLYDSLPTAIKILVLNGGVQSLVLSRAYLEGNEVNLQLLGTIWVGVLINIVAQELLNLKKNE